MKGIDSTLQHFNEEMNGEEHNLVAWLDTQSAGAREEVWRGRQGVLSGLGFEASTSQSLVHRVTSDFQALERKFWVKRGQWEIKVGTESAEPGPSLDLAAHEIVPWFKGVIPNIVLYETLVFVKPNWNSQFIKRTLEFLFSISQAFKGILPRNACHIQR